MRSSLSFLVIGMPFAAILGAQQSDRVVPYDADLFRKDVEVVSGHVGFLYWTVQEGALDYAESMRHAVPATSYATGKIRSASFHIDPGVRCAVSYFNAPKYWEVRAEYTHVMSKGKNRSEKPDGSNLYLTGTWPQILLNPLTHAHSSIAFHYNLSDLLVDRMFIPNPHLRLRMLAGLGVAWIKQDWKIQYFDITDQHTTVRNRWSYVGGGMRVGIAADWFWGSDVYLSGLTSVAAYMGVYHNRAKQTSSLEVYPMRDSYLSDGRPAFTAQVLIGPSWQKNFTHNRVELFTGYELNAWFNLQEIYRSTGGSASAAKELWMNSSILALQGLTTRLTIDF